MSSIPLSNYLRVNRKRLALSQDEVAFLLGVKSGAKVSRNEMFVRVPSLETAFAYEAIFQKPARELFSGLYQQIEQDVVARAKILTHRTERRRPNQRIIHKRKMLGNIAVKRPDNSPNFL
jgi:transcriptional regulator with XRE-family HTH domain